MPVTNHPSLFIVSLHYTGSLKEIDAVMGEHMVFLNKQYKAGRFLVSGRKVPRTGGVIIAKSADKRRLERIMKTDPFYKHKLASFDITEFLASQQSGEIKNWLFA